MVATKMDAHVIYDSTPPLLLSTVPVHNAAGVRGSASEPNAAHEEKVVRALRLELW